MSAYRTPADMPEKEEVMSDDVRIWKMVLFTVVGVVGTIAVAAVADTAMDGYTAEKVAASKSAESRAIADKAKADTERAMFEQTKACPK